ncbi:YisL family protein [Domibacillus epiphyticus]|uniref:Uncharacterized protein n=1 Tax=Domibacillus epiphyticus TaxID=1714355 RepID=A0A1V2A7Y4_9BACI|nr:YisL family protein [Domibacillus epiphyticus]OMP67109.1 hypothetical protein BTO28_09015 [Domibacillus epiphyticus]
MDFLSTNTHLHITTWAVAVILFFIALGKPSKGVHMALRLFYVLILISGFLLFMKYNSVDPMMYGLKMLGGILTIGLMEMTLVRKKKGKGTSGVLIGAVILLLITIVLGFRLPIGF